MSVGTSRTWLAQLAATAAAALVLCLAALWNGQPVFYPDTPTYLRGAEMGMAKVLGPGSVKPWLPARSAAEQTPDTATAAAASATATAATPARGMKALTSVEDKVVLAGRSVYYGALLYLGYLGGDLWLTIAVQALCVAYLLQLLLVRLWDLGAVHLVGAAVALSAFTPLAAYTGFLMPDIFAPLAILAMATLTVYWQRLRPVDRFALSALLLFGLMAHASHVAVAAGLLVVLMVARTLSRRWRGLALAGMVITAGCIVGAIAAEWAFNKAATVAIGAPPLRLPHPMARLIAMGPGTDYLAQHCPQAGFTACDYLKNYPTAWDDFLFSTDPARGAFALADGPAKRRLSDEQMRFVAAVVRHDPWGVATGIGADIVRQLSTFGVDIWGYGPREIAMYTGRVPDAVLAQLQSSRAAQRVPFNVWWTAATYSAVAVALAVALVLRRRNGRADGAQTTDPRQGFADFTAVVVAGVLVNAVVCATLASSLERFQARVIWLLPFLALAAWWMAAAAQRTAPDGTAPAARQGPSPLHTPLQGHLP